MEGNSMSFDAPVTEVTPQDVTVTPAPKAAKARAPRGDKLVPFSSIHVTFAKTKGVDVTKAAKLNRSYIRSNFEPLCKVWPELRKSQKINRDGNRYPAMIPVKAADMIVKRSIPQARGK
jgi:hypothetical protein